MRIGSQAFQLPSPVVLSSQCSVSLGNQASPQMSELSYPFRKPILIDEIRFDLWMDATQGYNLGALIYAKLMLGTHYLMRDFVPIWLLGTTMSRNEEEFTDAGIGANQCYSHYRWRLPEPLYVDAGQYISPVFSSPRFTNSPAGPITVQVSYAGRVVPPQAKRPNRIVVPYAAPFVTTFGNTYQQSNEYNLFNPFDKPLYIQRLTGRVLTDNTGSGGVYTMQINYTPAASQITTDVTLLIDDSWGGKIVNNLTGPGDVFDAMRGALAADVVMPAKGQINVRAWNIPTTSQVHIAMIGAREEALP